MRYNYTPGSKVKDVTSKVIKEAFSVSDIGKITKEGKKVEFKFEFTVPLEEFESMNEAKAALLKHHSRIQKIINNYFFLHLKSGFMKKRNALKSSSGKEVVKLRDILCKLGFIDEG